MPNWATILGNCQVCYGIVLRHKGGCRRHTRWCPCTSFQCCPLGSRDCKCNGMCPAGSRKLRLCKYWDSERTRWYLPSQEQMKFSQENFIPYIICLGGILPSPLWVLPEPNGHSCSNSSLSGCGQGWQGVPQPIGWPRITVQQQQLDFVTSEVEGFKHWPSRKWA